MEIKLKLILCDHSIATKESYPDYSLDMLIKCSECNVEYRITIEAIKFYFDTEKVNDNDIRRALLNQILMEYPKLQKPGLQVPEPVLVDTKLINYILSRGSYPWGNNHDK